MYMCMQPSTCGVGRVNCASALASTYLHACARRIAGRMRFVPACNPIGVPRRLYSASCLALLVWYLVGAQTNYRAGPRLSRTRVTFCRHRPPFNEIGPTLVESGLDFGPNLVEPGPMFRRRPSQNSPAARMPPQPAAPNECGSNDLGACSTGIGPISARKRPHPVDTHIWQSLTPVGLPRLGGHFAQFAVEASPRNKH